MLGNTTNVPDAFIFCPNKGAIQTDKLLDPGIFISENKGVRWTSREILSSMNKFTTLIFEEEVSTNVNCKLCKNT